ncbi:MAG: hypothetical protein RMZ43_019005 [Nostoc sp. CmiVER01]
MSVGLQMLHNRDGVTARRILLANIIHSCVFKYHLSSNLQSVVAAFSCNTFVSAFVTLSPTVSRRRRSLTIASTAQKSSLTLTNNLGYQSQVTAFISYF